MAGAGSSISSVWPEERCWMICFIGGWVVSTKPDGATSPSGGCQADLTGVQRYDGGIERFRGDGGIFVLGLGWYVVCGFAL